MSKSGANPNTTSSKFASSIMQNIQMMSQEETQKNLDFSRKNDIINVEEKKENNAENHTNISSSAKENTPSLEKRFKTKNPNAHSNDPNKVRQTIFITKKNLILLKTLSYCRHQDQTSIVNELLDRLETTLSDRERNYFRDNLREENLL